MINSLQNCTLDKYGVVNKNEWKNRKNKAIAYSWTPKQKRCFQRVMSGLTYQRIRGCRIRFLTLTSGTSVQNDIQRDFICLKMRIIRAFGTFEYIKVRTNEGNGVIHILYVGKYIPQSWLSRQWEEIHQSPIVDIRAVDRIKGLGRYFVSQYLSQQKCSWLRYSWSWKWVYCGFVKIWYLIRKENSRKTRCLIWNAHLTGHIIKLDGKFLKPPPDIGFISFEQTVLFFNADRQSSVWFAQIDKRCGWICKNKP